MAEIISFPQFDAPSEALQKHPELKLLDASALHGLLRHYQWRLDTLYAVKFSGLEWPDASAQAYHERELQLELDFCVSSIGAIKKRLEEL